MRRATSLLAALFLTTLLLVGCNRSTSLLLNVRSSVQTTPTQEELTLSFSLSEPGGQVQVHLAASDGKSSWSMAIEPDEEGTYTVGPVTMGSHIALPEGTWNLSVMLNDGQWLEQDLSVRRP